MGSSIGAPSAHIGTGVTGADSPNGGEDSEAPAELGFHDTRAIGELNFGARQAKDAGELLDAQTKAAYGRRLEQLREELEEAKEFRNPER